MKRSVLVAACLLSFAGHAFAQSVDTPPTTPGNPTARAYGPTSGGVAWQRSTDDRRVVGYEITRDGTVLGVRDTLSYVVDDLQPGRGYNIAVVAIDSTGQRSGRALARIETPDARPNRPTGLAAAVYSSTAAGITWERSGVFGERYEVKRDGEIVVAATNGTSYVDTALSARRPYLFEVIAVNRQGQRSAATRLFVDTREGSSSSPPVTQGLAAPTGLRSEIYSSTAGAIAWDRAGTPGLRYEVSRDGQVVATTDGVSYTTSSLRPGTDYAFEVIAIGRDGRRSAPSRLSVRTDGDGSMPPVAGGPPAPAALIARRYSNTAVELFWTRPTTPGLRYEVRRDGELGEVVTTTDGTSYYDDTLGAGREYRYEVVAIDRAGRRSGASTVTVTTPGSATPARPFGLTATRLTASEGVISWEPSTVPSRRYEISRDGEVLATFDGVSFRDDALEVGRSYRYEVVAIDAVGRRSNPSTVTLGNDGVFAIVDAERLVENVLDVIAGRSYRLDLLRLHQSLDSEFRGELVPTVGGDPIRLTCGNGGTVSYTRVEGAAETTTDYALDGCAPGFSRRSVYDGELTHVSGTFSGSGPDSPRVAGDNVVRSNRTRGPLSVGPSDGALTWSGNARVLVFAEGGVEVKLAADSLELPEGGGTLRVSGLDTTIECTSAVPLSIDSQLTFSSAETGGRTLDVRVLETLRTIDTADGARGLEGRVSVSADDGSRLEINWGEGDGSTYRVSIDNGNLGGERTLPTEPLLNRIDESLDGSC